MKNENGTLIHSDVEKTDLLNSNFHKVFKSDNKIELILERFVSPSNCLKDFEVTDADVASAFHKLADKLFETPDNIPAYFWKKAAAPLFHVICLLFNLSLVQGIVPSQWKTAIIVPVYKKGSRDNPGNYSPISLT